MPLSTTQKFRWGLFSATALAGLIVVIAFINIRTPVLPEHQCADATADIDAMALVGVLSLVGRRVVDRDDRQRAAATAEILRLRDLAEEEAARSEEETARAENEAARAEEFAAQAEESRERLEAVPAGISDGFLVMDRNLTVLFVNA
jgi:PAS domain-containing protein